MKSQVLQAVNNQIKEELNSAYIYLGMMAYAESKSLSGFANWFRVQAQEELDHAEGFFNHLVDRGAKVSLSALPKPKDNYKTILEAAQETLKHEQYITKKIHQLYETADQHKDYALVSLLKWYIDEQVEEEDSAQQIIDKVKMCDNKKHALYMVDKELLQREYKKEEIS